MFSSYVTDAAAIPADTADGTDFSYDGMQRTINVHEITNNGSVATAVLYGNKVQVNDHRGYVTT